MYAEKLHSAGNCRWFGCKDCLVFGRKGTDFLLLPGYLKHRRGRFSGDRSLPCAFAGGALTGSAARRKFRTILKLRCKLYPYKTKGCDGFRLHFRAQNLTMFFDVVPNRKSPPKIGCIPISLVTRLRRDKLSTRGSRATACLRGSI